MNKEYLYVIEDEGYFDIVLSTGEILATYGSYQCCEAHALGYGWLKGVEFKVIYIYLE